LNSMDSDGTQRGYDLALIQQARRVSTAPLIASGGAGSLADFIPAAAAGADALLAASVFHFGKFSIREVKQTLHDAGFEVRLTGSR
jgi:cyclase